MVVAIVVLPALGGLEGIATAVPPPTPTLSTPANGASVTIPVTISWSQVAGAGGYNWQVSVSSGFTSILEQNPSLLIGAATTQDVVSGLANGTYFWRVQAVSPDLEAGAWSSPRSFIVTGAGPGVPGTATLDPPLNATQFHSWENITFTWSAVPGAVSYILQESVDPTFPVDTRTRQVNIPGPTERISFNPSTQGNFKARVIAVGPSGLMGTPSNTVDFSVADANPFPAAPTLVAPSNGTSTQLPLTLSWTHVPNHDELGYQLQIATNSSFTAIEATYGVTENTKIISALTTGTKFWRVRSQHGYIGADPAYTAFSSTGTFTVLSTPLRMGAVTFPRTKFSGGEARGTIEITGNAPAGGVTVTFSTDRPDLLPELPASRQIAAGTSSSEVLVAPTGAINSLRGMRVGFVSAPTTVTVTASFNGTSVSTPITIVPPKLNDTPFQLFPVKATGGEDMLGIVDLEVGCFAGFCDGLAPPGGFVVNLSSSSPAAVVPATMTIPAGAGGDQFPIQTTPVTKDTTLTITATAGGATANWYLTLTPSPAPDSLTLDPIETDNGSRGIIRIPLSSMRGHDQLLRLTSSNPAVAAVPQFATVPASTETGIFFITTSAVTTRTVVTISVTGGGVTRSVDLVVHPSLPALTGFSLNPTSVPGGTSATGTVTLGSPAPAGGLSVSLSSNLPGSASVPPTVTVPAGATSASFTVTTFPVDNTTAQLTATLGNTTLFAALSITRAQTATLSTLTLSPSTVVGGASSTGTVILSAAAPSGGAVVSLSDNSASATVPASVTVAAGATSRTFTVTTSAVSNTTAVSVSGSYGGVTRSANLTINPLAAPTLQSPANTATGVAQPVAFDWADVVNAVDYEIQVDDTSTISAPFVANQTVSVSQASIGGLPAQQLWWRVRARNAAGVFGPFSSTRRFTPVSGSVTPSLSAVAVAPTSVVGGASSTGTVTLTAAAPTGGAVVSLASANTVVTVPASVTIAAGATSATFTATTSSVAASTPVTLTATYSGVSRTTTLTVNPPASLSAVAVAPASVVGGASSTGTVTLSSAAPAGGMVVTLNSSNAAATVPASVTVAAGAATATFTATTQTVTAQTPVTITAAAGGASRTATLTVNPPASGTLPAPSLVSPATDARFNSGQTIVFDWSDVAGAASYIIQVDDQDTFSSPLVDQTVSTSTHSTSALPVARMWFRVRAVSASGVAGAWSSGRRFEVR
ncbi:MAG: hypothetical protein QOJ08_1855 [Ilumatobacteraceae bacterium]